MRLLIYFSLVPILAGCAVGVPRLPDEKQLPTRLLFEEIRCEVDRAAVLMRQRDSGLADWQGVYTITLTIFEIGSVKAPANTFPIPITAGILNLGVNGGYSRTTKRIAIAKFAVDVASADDRCDRPDYASVSPLLSGRLGIEEWFGRALDAIDTDKGKPTDLTTLAHTFDFTVDATAGVSPTFLITPTTRTSTFGPSLNGERSDDNTVDVVFAKPAKTSLPPKVVAVPPKPISSKLAGEERRAFAILRDLDKPTVNDFNPENASRRAEERRKAQATLAIASAARGTTTYRTVPGGTVTLPPSNNAALAATSLELTLQRTLGNLPLTR